MVKLPKRKPRSFRQLIPNLLTIFVICAGLTSVRFGIDGKYGFALLLIVLAAVLDAADGKLARFLDSVTPIGAELDSLADFFNFGIAPGLLIYFSIFHGTEHANLGWLSVMVMAACVALRLARFNVALDSDQEPTWKSQYFVGVPAPAAGCLALLPMFFLMLGVEDIRSYPVVIFAYLVVVGLLAVSTIPTMSIKHVRIAHDWYLGALLGGTAFVASLVVYTWQTLIAGCALYLVSVFVSASLYYKKQKLSVGTKADSTKEGPK